MKNSVLMEGSARERLWNADYVKTMVANFAMSFAFYLLTPVLPLYLSESFNASKDTIGLVLSGYTITALLARPLSGYVVDSFPRKTVLMASLFFYTIMFVGYVGASTLLLFAIVRTVHGAPFGAATVANSTVAVDVLPASRRNEGIGYYGLSNNVGTAIAPTVSMLIYTWDNHDFTLIFWLAFVVSLVGLAVDATVKLRDLPPLKDRHAISLDRFFQTRVWALALSFVLFGSCYGMLSNYLGIYGKETMGITGGTGIYFLILSSGLILSRLQGARSLRRGDLARNAVEGVLISTVGYLLFVLCPNAWGYYGSALLIGLGNGHLWPAFQNMVIGVADSDGRGTANSTIFTCWDLGIGLGVLYGGFVAEYVGYTGMFMANVAVHIIGVLWFVTVAMAQYRRLRARQTQNSK